VAIFSESPIAGIIAHFYRPEHWLGSANRRMGALQERERLIVSEILKFPDNVLRMSKNSTPEQRATKAGTVANMPSRPVPPMTGDQWNEFVRLLRPDEQQAFLTDVWKLINRYCQRIGRD
jgi:hypothetical protein